MRAFNIILALVIFSAAGAGAEWQVEVVSEESPLGVFVLDAQDQPHVAYSAGPPGEEVRYACRTESGWEVQTVDVAPDDVSLCFARAITVDTPGRPQILYSNEWYGVSELKCAIAEENGWRILPFNEFTVGPAEADMRSDRHDRPHVAYSDFDEDGNLLIKYTVWTGAEWETETAAAEPGNSHIWCISLRLDANDRPHISYTYGGYYSSSVNYAHRTESGWRTDVVDDESRAGDTSLVVDANGVPHVAYFAGARCDLKYASRRGEEWVIETVDWTGIVGERPEIYINKEGEPTVFYDGEFGPRVAVRENGRWSIATLDAEALAGEWWSVKLDSHNHLCVLYAKDAAGHLGALTYAEQTGADWPVTYRGQREEVIAHTAYPVINKWGPSLSLITPGEPWEAIIYSPYREGLYESPGDYGGETVPWEDGSVAEVVDGLSLWEDFECRYDGYETWLKVTASGSTGWSKHARTKPDYVDGNGDNWSPNLALIRFTSEYSPLREGPSPDYDAVKKEDSYSGFFEIKPIVPAGATYEVVARCGDWLCIGSRGAGAWLPADAAGIEFYYLLAGKDYAFYCPVAEDVGRIIYAVNTRWGYDAFEDPILEVITAEGRVAVIPALIGGYSIGLTSGRPFMEAVLPEPIKRRDIVNITLTTGPATARTCFIIDPREAWAEYDAQR